MLRDGRLGRLPSAELVTDDWVRLEAGDRVPADGVLIDSHGAMVDEAVLTGESVPVDKAAGDEVFSGTLLVRGKTCSPPGCRSARICSAARRCRVRCGRWCSAPPDSLVGPGREGISRIVWREKAAA